MPLMGLLPARTISKIAITPKPALPDRSGIAIVLIVKNEGRHIAEWARFHHIAGVRHFYVYDASDDDTLAQIRSALPPEMLTVIPWDQRLSDARSGAEIHNQVLAYAHALRNFGPRHRWMAFIDVDEFMIPVHAGSLDDALIHLGDVAHISMPWHMFGRNGFEDAPAGGMLPNYIKRMADPFSDLRAMNFKCLVDPARVTGVRVHGFDIDGRSEGVNDAGRLAPHSKREDRAFFSAAHIQLNHYYSRSNAELMAKINRGSNKTVDRDKHLSRVMRIVNAIEAQTTDDRTALDYLERVGAQLPL